MAYDPNRDYQAAIDKAKSEGADYQYLSALESQRNEKIAAGYGKNYTQTHDYAMPDSSTAPPGFGSQSQNINGIFDAKSALTKATLDSTYRKNVAALNAMLAKIPDTYNTARNQTAAASEQSRAAFNEQAAASGINSGAGSQANLAIGNTLASNLGALNKQEATDTNNINAQLAEVEASYNNGIAQAQAEGNLAKAQAIYEESVRAQNQLLEQQKYKDSQLSDQKSEFAKTLGAYYFDYQQEINNVKNNNDASDDWKIPYLEQARNEKILAEQEAAAKAAAKTKSGGGGGGYDDNTPRAAMLNDAAAAQQVGMNRTATGQLATVQRLYDAGQITEAQANALIKKFNLG